MTIIYGTDGLVKVGRWDQDHGPGYLAARAECIRTDWNIGDDTRRIADRYHMTIHEVRLVLRRARYHKLKVRNARAR